MNPLFSVLVGLLIIGISVVIFLFIIDMIIDMYYKDRGGK